MAAGERGWHLTVPHGAVAVEHVLLNDVHGPSVNPSAPDRPVD